MEIVCSTTSTRRDARQLSRDALTCDIGLFVCALPLPGCTPGTLLRLCLPVGQPYCQQAGDRVLVRASEANAIIASPYRLPGAPAPDARLV